MFDRDGLRSLLTQAGIKNIADTGRGFIGACPFHHTKSGRPWGISLEGAWSCLNPECGASGTLQTLVMRLLGVSAEDAALYKPVAVVPLPAALPSWDKRGKAHEIEPTMPDVVLDPFRSCPRYMLDRRGFTKEFCRKYEIGYDRSFTHRLWEDADTNGAVVFPVRNVRGKLVGLSRRVIPGAPGQSIDPAYLHDYERALHLYLLHLVPWGERVLVCEGAIDALKARFLAEQAGAQMPDDLREAMGNAVSVGGSAMSKEQADLLSARYGDVWLGTDPDTAGAWAADRAIKLLVRAGSRIGDVIVTPELQTSDGAAVKSDLGAMDLEHAPLIRSIPYWQRARSRGR